MNTQQFVVKLTALSASHRLSILALLHKEGRLHVSEIARRIGMSRALLYMHITKLEEAGFVVGKLELGKDGKAMKYFEVLPFEMAINPDYIEEIVQTSNEEENSL